MQQLGQATWRVENGEIVGTPDQPGGGWLLLDQGYQDVQLGAALPLLRGMHGGRHGAVREGCRRDERCLHVISADERSPAAITVNAQGAIANREPLSRSGGSMARFAPPAPAPGTAKPRAARGGWRAPGGGRRRSGPAAGFTSMFTRPDTSYKAERLEPRRSR